MKNDTSTRKKVSRIDWARLAAYIDGEGCIRIDLQQPSPGNKFSARHLLEIRVYNTDPRLPLWCKETFGGGGYKPVGRRGKSHHKQEVVWYAGASTAEWILRNCLPFFILKRDRAEVALALRALGGKHGLKVTPEMFAAREALRLQMKVLNQRGSVQPEVV